MSSFERPRKISSNKDVGEKYDVPCCEAKFYWDYKCIKYLQNLCLFHEVGNDMVELLQRFKSLHVHGAARKQSSILTYFSRK